MTLPADHPFARPRSRFRPDLAALVATVVIATGVVTLDLGTQASAADGIDSVAAVNAARAQGFEGTNAQAESRYDRVARRTVWDVRGAEGEHAVVDAKSGDLVSLEF